MSMIHVLLLTALLRGALTKRCPAHCQCDFESESSCVINDFKVRLQLTKLGSSLATLSITCEGKNFTCADLPQLDVPYVHKFWATGCPPSILRCANGMLTDQMIDQLDLSDVDELLTSEDVQDLKDVTRLEVRYIKNTLTKAVEIPVVTINAWLSLEKIYISQGYLQLDSNSFVHDTLNRMVFTGTRVSSIPKGAFSKVPNLTKVYMRDDKVETGIVSAGAFADLLKLQVLRIENMGVKSIETGAFANTPMLKDLILNDNPFESIPNGFLDGSESLNGFTMSCVASADQAVLKLGSHAFANRRELTTLELTGCKLDQLPDTLFSGSHNLTDISIKNNVVKNISSNIFSNLTALTKLDLYNNTIKALSNGILSNLISLQSLNLAHNEIVALQEGIFNSLTSLQQLNLSNNYVTYLDKEIFAKLTNLRILSLDHNDIQRLPEKVFTKLTALITLDLEHNKINILTDEVFSELTSLELLNLEHNNIEELPAEIFSALKLRRINLANNKILKLNKGIMASLVSLEILKLSNNNIHEIPNDMFFNLTSLKSMNLANNKIRTLPHMENLSNLRELNLRNNTIKKLSVYMFLGLTNLTDLDLSNNELKTIQAYPYGIEFSPFSPLDGLLRLDLSGNDLQQFYERWDYDLQQLKLINLSHNHFTDFKGFHIDYSDLNVTLDLQHNMISEISLDPRVSISKDTPKASSHVILANNPLNCDCHNYGLYLRYKEMRLPTEPEHVLDNAKCASPLNLHERLFTNVSAADFICDLTKQGPKVCSSFIAKAASNEIALTCEKLPSILPDIKSMRLPINFDQPRIILNLKNQPDSLDNVNTHTLNLSNTGIQSIKFKPTYSLKILDLSHNKLASIPDEFLENNITLYLSDNPLICDCTLVKKLKLYNALADLQSVTCSNKDHFKDIEETEICNKMNTLTSFIGTTLVCGAFLTMIIVALCKYIKNKWREMLKSFRKRDPVSCIFLERIEVNKKFDVFVSFAYQDEEFVRESILPRLQFELSQKVCVHYHDWMDEMKPEQLIDIDNSRKTLIILSENFLSSEWAYSEFNRAHTLSNQDGRSRVIIISLDKDIIADDRLSEELKSYVGTDSYMLSEDINLWHSIQHILQSN